MSAVSLTASAASAASATNTWTTEFSVDWTSHNFPHWEQLLAPARESEAEILEIGSWEGRSAIWFLNYMPKSRITCVDTWAGGQEHRDGYDLGAVERRFDANVLPYGTRVEKVKKRSHIALAELGIADRYFELIYVDGSHRAADVYADGILAWPLLKRGGAMIFDDYLWEAEADFPRPGIDAFLRKTSCRIIAIGTQIVIVRPQ